MHRNQLRNRYGPKVNVWSGGCVLLKMWLGGRVWWDGDMFALMVKVSCVSMSPSGLLTENVRMSACVDWDLEHGDRP